MISIVISVFNEERVLFRFYEELTKETQELACEAEFIFVNDGSVDKSLEIIENLACGDKRIKVINFSRNFGHEAAMIAGIDNAVGDAIVCMDADLQNPPSLLKEMLQHFEQGSDVVTMVRDKNLGVGFFKKTASKMFYKVFNRLSEIELQPNASDFFLVSNRVAEVLRKDYRERVRFLRGYIQTVGFNRSFITYTAPSRAAGESKYSLSKLFRLVFSSIVSFSKVPLKIGIYFGLFFGLLSIVLMVYSLVMWIVERPVGGYTTLVIFLCAFAAITLFVLGIIGYYIGFILDEVKGRPIYVIESIKNDND